MHDWNQILKTTATLLAIVKPIGGVPLFIAATVLCVLRLATFLCTALLEFMGVGRPSFLAGGGMLLMIPAVSMMEAREAAERAGLGVVPRGIPILAGPGFSSLRRPLPWWSGAHCGSPAVSPCAWAPSASTS